VRADHHGHRQTADKTLFLVEAAQAGTVPHPGHTDGGHGS
jgi:hypothetical protein